MNEELRFHPAAELFPAMDEQGFEALVEDIRENKLLDPITVHQGCVLDGRHRYRACKELGIEATFEQWDGESGTPEAFVISRNLHRRHLNESQRAMIAGKLAMLSKGDVASQRIKKTEENTEGEISTPPKTAEEAGKMLNVHRSTVIYAKTVLNEGTAEEIAAVKAGDAAVSTTARRICARRPKAKKKTGKLAQTGRNPERIQRQKLKSEIWGHVRGALAHLTSLPLPADVAKIVRNQSKSRAVVDRQLDHAAKWLEEFKNEWKSKSTQVQDDNPDGRNGDEAA